MAASLLGSLYVFFLFSHASEFIDSTGHLRLVAIVAILATFAALLGGKLLDSISSTTGISLSLFTILLIVGIPFSVWKGGSFKAFADLWWKSYVTFCIVSALTFSIGQMRRLYLVLASASVGIVYLSIKAGKADEGRLSLEYGSLGNANDLASALLICLPFVTYVILDKSRNALVRLAFVGIAVMILLTVTKTGSRASLLVLGGMALLMFFKAGIANKAKILACSALLIAVLPLFVSKELITRYATTFSASYADASPDTAVSAIQSTQARKELMRNAVILTFRHPVFGVGLGNFYMQSSNLEVEQGNPPLWFTCHNVFLLVSSETGLPGLLCFITAIGSSIITLLKIQRATKNVAALAEVSAMCFCLTMSLFAYVATGLFNTNAYGMQMPALAGLTVAMYRVTKPIIIKADEQRLNAFRLAIPIQPSKLGSG